MDDINRNADQGICALTSRAEAIFVAFGANTPSGMSRPAETLRAALYEMELRGLQARDVSGFHITPAFPAGSGQPDFVNAAARIETRLTPGETMHVLLEIERQFGRERQAAWAARPLDLDLLAYGDIVTAGYWEAAAQGQKPPEVPPKLLLPHPRLHGRRFVLEPLCEIAPAWQHPALGMAALQLLRRLPA